MMYLAACTRTLLDECARPELNQKHIALTYAMAIRSENAGADTVDWPAVNRAIVKRWSMAGLEHIKRQAWKMVDAQKPAA